MRNYLHSLLLAIFFIFTSSHLLRAQAPNWQWALSAGDVSTDEVGNGIASDASGNVYTTGSFASNTLAIGTATLSRVGLGNVYVTKQDVNGNVLWAKKFGGVSAGVGGGAGYAICTDGSGNVYVTGYYTTKLVVGTTTLTSSDTTATNVGDIFIAKLDGSGNVVWAKSAGGTVSDIAYGISVDASGNVFLTGSYRSHTISFGSISFVSPNNLPSSFFTTTDVFVAKYDASGTPVWVKSAGTAGNDDGKGITVDAGGNVLVVGSFYLVPITFGTTTLTATAAINLFVTKYDNSGNVVWAKTASAAGSGSINHAATSISADASNNVYLTGNFIASTLTIGSVSMVNPAGGSTSAFTSKLDPSGNCLWARSAGFNSGTAFGTGIAADGSGNSFVTGYFTGTTLPMGTYTLTNNNVSGNNEDVFVAKYDASGTLAWAKSVGGTYRELSNGISVDGSGNGAITGKITSPTVAVGATTLTSGGSGVYSDLFIAKLGNGVGIKEYTNSIQNVLVYPNPFSSSVSIQFTSEITNADLNLFNLCGQKVKSLHFAKEKTITIERDHLPSGVYFLQILQNTKTVYTQKLVVTD